MSIPIQTKVRVLTKYVNDYTKSDGEVAHYYNLQFINPNGRAETIPVSEEVYNSVEIDKEYQLAGVCGGMGAKKWFNFDKIVK